MYPQVCSIMLSQQPVRTHFENTRAHPGGQCSPWGHTRKQVLYLLKQVVAAKDGLVTAMTMLNAPKIITARDEHSMRNATFLASSSSAVVRRQLIRKIVFPYQFSTRALGLL
jgi:hypothetical protein